MVLSCGQEWESFHTLDFSWHDLLFLAVLKGVVIKCSTALYLCHLSVLERGAINTR